MKKSILTIALSLSFASAFAQSSVSPSQVCSRVAQVNGSNGAICAQLISRNTFDPAALELAYKAVAQNSATAIEVLKATANRRMDMGAGQTCERILAVNASNGVICAQTVVDTMPSPELLNIANRLVSQGSAYAVSALKAGANAYMYAPLADVCAAMASVNAGNTVLCVEAIANKVSMNGAEQVCQTSMAQGSSYALQCVRNIVMDYTPIPQPTGIMVELYKMQDLKRALLKSRAQIDRGLIDGAQRSIDEAINAVDMILSNPNQM